MGIDLEKSISEITFCESWKEIPIVECGEPLISIGDKHDRIVISPYYFKIGLNFSSNEIFIRESIFAKLVNALRYIPSDLFFVVWDGWRSFELQTILYNRIFQDIKSQNPKLCPEKIQEIAIKYVSFPNKNINNPSPHSTGGSIDLTLSNKSGELAMGTDFDDFTNKASTVFYEKKTEYSKKDIEIRNNRRLLYYAMKEVGLSNYPKEWWHFDYGNQFWAASLTKDMAIYGLIAPD